LVEREALLLLGSDKEAMDGGAGTELLRACCARRVGDCWNIEKLARRLLQWRTPRCRGCE